MIWCIYIVKIGEKHPQALTEGTGLSCVSPPPINYQLKMESRFYQTRGNVPAFLSNAQLEPILYACQAHTSFIDKGETIRKGFLLGKFAQNNLFSFSKYK